MFSNHKTQNNKINNYYKQNKTKHLISIADVVLSIAGVGLSIGCIGLSIAGAGLSIGGVGLSIGGGGKNKINQIK